MGILAKDGVVWKDSVPYVRDAGIWKPVDTGFVKDAGVWKETYSSGWVLEGSWETGWEGWTVMDGNPARVNNNARTGAYSVRLQGRFFPPLDEIGYTIPSENAAKNIKLSLWAKNPGYWGDFVNNLAVYLRLGGGSYTALPDQTISADYVLHEYLIENPNLQGVDLVIRGRDPESYYHLDDWKIEGWN